LIVFKATEHLGMPMVYTLVVALVEKLEADNENRKMREAEEKDRRAKEIEAEEQKRFDGTKVTVETFLRWKASFDKEMNELKKKVDVSGKTTGLWLLFFCLVFELDFNLGKQLFERSDAMIESDLQFDDDDIDVDESLFQTMEGLDLGPAEEFSDDDDDDDEEEEE
jgi:hypothetical protein